MEFKSTVTPGSGETVISFTVSDPASLELGEVRAALAVLRGAGIRQIQDTWQPPVKKRLSDGSTISAGNGSVVKNIVSILIAIFIRCQAAARATWAAPPAPSPAPAATSRPGHGKQCRGGNEMLLSNIKFINISGARLHRRQLQTARQRGSCATAGCCRPETPCPPRSTSPTWCTASGGPGPAPRPPPRTGTR